MKTKGSRFVKAIAALVNKKTWGPFTEAYETSKFDHAFSISWSQAGEDLALMPILGRIPKGRYLDIGAHHPSRFSVTRNLFQSGWSGVNVDANSDLLASFMRQRPADVNINCCVGSKPVYEIAIFKEAAISTVNPDWISRFKAEHNEISETRNVPGVSLHTIIKEHFPTGDLDFMNLDIEGADLDALKSADFENLDFMLWPKWVLVEAVAPVKNSLSTPAVELLMHLGYLAYLVLPYAVLLQKPNSKI